MSSPNRRAPPIRLNASRGRLVAASLSAVSTQPDGRELELLVLAAIAPGGTSVGNLAVGLDQPPATVETAVARLAEGGLVEPGGDVVTLTESGRLVADRLRESWPATVSGPLTTIDFAPVARFVESLLPDTGARQAEERAARGRLLAADEDRNAAVNLLSDAYAQGRLSSAELEQRTGQALAARTYGELDAVLEGLQRPVRNHPVRKGVFWGVGVLSSPFVLMGTLLFLFGTDTGDHVAGLVFLVLLLPGLFALRRWAWPRG